MAIAERLTDDRQVIYSYPASTAIAAGDLLYFDGSNLKKASQQTDQASEILNQLLFARYFAGVSQRQRLSTETTAESYPVITDGIFDCTCPSTAWAVGDLVGASENSGGDALENQQVEKVTDPTAAIGYCVKAGTSLTTVRCRLIAKHAPKSVDRGVQYVSYYFTGTPAATDQVVFVAPHACRVVAISEVHSVAAGGASTIQVVKDTGTAAPGAGTDLLSSAFDLNATANTPQHGALSATASDLELARGDRLSVDFANTIQSTAGVCITVGLVPL